MAFHPAVRTSLFALVIHAALSPALADDAFDRLNALRLEAGLDALHADFSLEQAAAQHADYLDQHRKPGQPGQGSAHSQQKGLAGFSGSTPAERALSAGYSHGLVLENVSMGYQDVGAAMDGLMSAIYHRLTFLDFKADEVGIASGERSRVFMLGRSDMVQTCTDPAPEALLQQPKDCLGQKMRRSHYQQLCHQLPPQAHFKPAYPVACPGGNRLDADFMQAVCKQPPAAARFGGNGRYYQPCGDETRIDANWFDQVCRGEIAGALHTAGSRYYKLCEDVLGEGVDIQAEWLEAYCADLPQQARYTDSMRYRLPCADAHELRVEYLAELDRARLLEHPKLIVWPSDGASDVPPAFFIEEPDPLPDHDVSGNPVSIQVNPAYVEHAELKSFTLQRISEDGLETVGPTRLLDYRSDPHSLLDTHQFALFPLRRLEWGARYQANAQLLLDGKIEHLQWRFTTRGDQDRILTAAAKRQSFTIQPGIEYLLYLPPGGDNAATATSVQYQHGRKTEFVMQALDANSVRVLIRSQACDAIELRFSSGREVTLVSSSCPA